MTLVDEVGDLADKLDGQLYRPGDAGYDAAVSGFNAAVTHAAPIVVAAASAQDVVATVRHAAAAGLPVAVQATGHGAHLPVEQGVLINTSLLAEVRIDPAARTATVGAGTKWRAVLDAAAEHGLAGLCGSTSDVGVVGYTVGGGLPVLGRAFGFAAERVRSFEVVTADSALRSVDADRDPELFWALRGGAGNAGIVTSMSFDLLPVERIYGGALFFPGDAAVAVLGAYAEWVRTVPDEMCTSLAFLRLPPLPDVPEPLRGQFVMHLRVAFAGTVDEGERLLAPMRACAPVLIDAAHNLLYRDLDLIHQDPDHPVPAYDGGCLLRDLDTDTVRMLLAQAGPDSGSPLLLTEVRHLGGALARTGALACDAPDGAFGLTGIGVLAGPGAAAVPSAVAALLQAAAPHASGRTLVNFHGTPGDEADRARAWSAQNYERLRRIKAAYDPGNMFRFGHAIEPAA